MVKAYGKYNTHDFYCYKMYIFYYRQTIVDILDLTLFKDLIYVNVAVGLAFALYSDISFLTIQPSYLFSLDFSNVLNESVLTDCF